MVKKKTPSKTKKAMPCSAQNAPISLNTWHLDWREKSRGKEKYGRWDENNETELSRKRKCPLTETSQTPPKETNGSEQREQNRARNNEWDYLIWNEKAKRNKNDTELINFANEWDSERDDPIRACPQTERSPEFAPCLYHNVWPQKKKKEKKRGGGGGGGGEDQLHGGLLYDSHTSVTALGHHGAVQQCPGIGLGIKHLHRTQVGGAVIPTHHIQAATCRHHTWNRLGRWGNLLWLFPV